MERENGEGDRVRLIVVLIPKTDNVPSGFIPTVVVVENRMGILCVTWCSKSTRRVRVYSKSKLSF